MKKSTSTHPHTAPEEVSSCEEDEEGDKVIREGISAKLSVTPVIRKDTLVATAPSINGICHKAKAKKPLWMTKVS